MKRWRQYPIEWLFFLVFYPVAKAIEIKRYLHDKKLNPKFKRDSSNILGPEQLLKMMGRDKK